MNLENEPCLFQPDFEDCTLSSLEPLSLECELHPLTTTLLEARIKLQQKCVHNLQIYENLQMRALPPSKAQHKNVCL